MINLAKSYMGADRDVLNELMDYYNKHCYQLVSRFRRYKIKPHDNWCAMFTSVIAHKMGVVDFPYEVSVMEQVKIAKDEKRFYTRLDEIKQGDLVFFDWNKNGWCDHVGFVDRVEDGFLYTVEGNKGGTVSERKLPINSKVIYGFYKV